MPNTNTQYEYIDKAGLDELAAKIALKYAAKTEIPTKTSDLTNDSTFQTETEVAASIASAIAGVTQFDYQIVASLPAEGVKGVVYLVANSGAGQNIYDEYIWVVSGDPAVGRFELFGTKELEVVEYVGDGTYVEIVDGTGDLAGKKVAQPTSATVTSLGKANTALQSVTSTGETVVVTGSGDTKNLEVAQTIVNGAAAGATAVQPENMTPITTAYIDSLFA